MASVKTNLLLSGTAPVTVSGASTATRYFPGAPGSSIGVAGIKNGILFIPGNNMVNGQRNAIRAGGNFTIGTPGSGVASPAVTIALFPVTFPNQSAAANSNVSAIGVTSAATIGSTAIVSATFAAASDLAGFYPFALLADLEGDSNSGLVQFCGGSIQIDGVNTNGTVGLVTGLSSINFANPVPFGVVVGITTSVADSGFIANMYQFDVQY